MISVILIILAAIVLVALFRRRRMMAPKMAPVMYPEMVPMMESEMEPDMESEMEPDMESEMESEMGQEVGQGVDQEMGQLLGPMRGPMMDIGTGEEMSPVVVDGDGEGVGEEGVVEGFYTYPGYYKKYCPSCYGKSSYTCSSCTNCGIITHLNGGKQCVPGDSKGPNYHDKFFSYSYGNMYDFYPYKNVYGYVNTFDQYPHNLWNTTGWRYKYGYNDYQSFLKQQALRTRDLARRLEYGRR